MKKHFLPLRSFVRGAPTVPSVTPTSTLNCTTSSVIDSVMDIATTKNVSLLAPNSKPETITCGDARVRSQRMTRLGLYFAPLCCVLCTIFCAAVLTSCSAAQIDLEAITTPPENITIANDLVTLPQGIAVAVRVHTDASMDPESPVPYISMTSANPAIISVWPTTRESVFVLGGASQGVAAFSVSVQGVDSHTFTATVVANPNANNRNDNDTDDNASNSEALTQPPSPSTRP